MMLENWVTLSWVPGDNGIWENENADRPAKVGSQKNVYWTNHWNHKKKLV